MMLANHSRIFCGRIVALSTATTSNTIIVPAVARAFFSVQALSENDKRGAIENVLKSSRSPGQWMEVEGRNAIHKVFEFIDFKQAWSFMSDTAELAEQMDHHPEWFNIYNKVEVTLTTHECGGVSSKDIDMALQMNEFESNLMPRYTGSES